jgi:DNA-binding NtrC family response regulator
MGATLFLVNPDAAGLARQAAELQAAGFGVVAVTAFPEARELLRVRRPDVLVTTLRVGAYNGIHLALAARALHRRLPVIVCGGCDVVLEAEARRAGARYLSGPVGKIRLVSEIWRALQGRRGALGVAPPLVAWRGAVDALRAPAITDN